MQMYLSTENKKKSYIREVIWKLYSKNPITSHKLQA